VYSFRYVLPLRPGVGNVRHEFLSLGGVWDAPIFLSWAFGNVYESGNAADRVSIPRWMRTTCAEDVAIINKYPSDLARDELRNRDTQNASENLEKPLTRLMQDMINLEGDRAQRQDQQANTVLQGTQKVNERLDRIELTVETNGKQLSEILSLLKNGLRRSEQLPLPSTSQYAYGQGARPDSLSLPGHTQYAPAVRSEHLSYPGNMQYVPSFRHLRQPLTAIC
jgi:hypothetical protein